MNLYYYRYRVISFKVRQTKLVIAQSTPGSKAATLTSKRKCQLHV